MASRPTIPPYAAAAMPTLFVLLWSTGFIGAKLGLPHAEPLTFLTARFLLAAAIMTVLAALAGAPAPRDARALGHLAVAGCLLNTVYLGGVYVAISRGIGAGTSALIVSLQPLIIAAVAGPVLGEPVSRRQWGGLVLGLLGCGLVVWPKLGTGEGDTAGLLLCGVALLGIAAGTLYQKRFCQGMDLRSGTAVQFWASAVSTGAAALALENLHVEWAPELIVALLWLVLVLSLGAITLLYLLIRRGAASRVSALFFLVPPTTAAMAWAMFGETLTPLQLVGMAVAAAGVALVTLSSGAGAAPPGPARRLTRR
jgi:drug/metabolite transporter (DMT)-like permease